MSITWLDIPAQSGLTAAEIKLNFDALMDYCSPFFTDALVFPTLRSSASGISHFAECKQLFNLIYVVGLLCAIAFTLLCMFKHHRGEIRYLLVSAITAVALPTLLVIGSLINFRAIFLLFHQIAFDNDDWLFDPYTDPVINILPESYFMECAILICIVVILGAAIVFGLWLFRRHRRRNSGYVPSQKNYYY